MLDKSSLKLNIPKFPRLIIEILNKAGFDAYIVGGCVRDQLLNLTPSDFDITTNAKPDEIKKLFKRTIDTGIKHGTVSVLFYEKNVPHVYEVTTYRIDGKYSDGRHPENVTFVDDLREDLRRRDFTVNAMAYNDDMGLVDEFDGLTDLKNKVIRAVGNPHERFEEDALRLLRAIRFAAKLGFIIDKSTANAIPRLSKNLSLVSKERVQVELTKTITSDNPDYIKLAKKYGLDKYICDGFDRIKIGKFEKKLPVHLAYACLLYHEKPDTAEKILRALKLDNNNIYKTTSLVTAVSFYKNIKTSSLKKSELEFDLIIKESIDYLGYPLIYDYIKLMSINENDANLINKLEKRVHYFEDTGVPIFTKDLNINGNDLISIGFKGLEVGYALKKLKELVHIEPKLNQKKLLQDIAKKAYNIYQDKITA